MAAHLNDRGLLIVEPWFPPGVLEAGRTSLVVVEEPDLKLARMSTLQIEDSVSAFDFHFLIGTPSGVEQRVESHRMGLFTGKQMRDAFAHGAMSVEHDPNGPTGRELCIGRRR